MFVNCDVTYFAWWTDSEVRIDDFDIIEKNENYYLLKIKPLENTSILELENLDDLGIKRL